MQTSNEDELVQLVQEEIRASRAAQAALLTRIERSERQLAERLRLAAEVEGVDVLIMAKHAQECVELQRGLDEARTHQSALAARLLEAEVHLFSPLCMLSASRVHPQRILSAPFRCISSVHQLMPSAPSVHPNPKRTDPSLVRELSGLRATHPFSQCLGAFSLTPSRVPAFSCPRLLVSH